MVKRFKKFVEDAEKGIPTIMGVVLTIDGESLQQLNEGKWIDGRFDRNIRLDQSTHLQGEGPPNAHVYGRKGDEIVAVNLDGTGSHGTKGRLHPGDADALRASGYTIRPDRIVEWWELMTAVQMLID